jgi:hypothetical protein
MKEREGNNLEIKEFFFLCHIIENVEFFEWRRRTGGGGKICEKSRG